MFGIPIHSREIEVLHEKSMELLETVGVLFEDEAALALFRRHGANVDGSRVCFGEALLREALASTPGAFTVRGSASSVTLGGGEPVYVGSSNAMFLLRGDRPMVPMLADFINTLKLCDTSSALHMVNCQQLYVSDLPADDTPRVTTALALRYSGKPVVTLCGNYEQSLQSLSVAKDFFAGETGYYALGVGNMVSPLRYTKESVGAIRAYAEYAQPLVLACCASRGMTCPVTVSGALIQNNAEVLAGIVYARLLCPGLPVVYGNVTSGLDMRHMTSAIGAFEAFAMIPYIKALGDYYKLPVRAGGALNDSKQIDSQSGAESALALAATIGGGVDFAMHMAGELDSYNLYSFEKQVLDEELIHRIRFARESASAAVSREDLEVLGAVGPGGQFLLEEQTLERHRSSLCMPGLAQREPYASWDAGARLTVEQKARQEVQRRLEEYAPPQLSINSQKILENICKNI